MPSPSISTWLRSALVASLGLLAPSVARASLVEELSADAILNGAYPFPPSPAGALTGNLVPRLDGLMSARLGTTPAPGVHPRLLTSPEELPELRRRIKETNIGRALLVNLRARTEDALRNPKNWGSALYAALAAGDTAAVNALLAEHKGLPSAVGHYQPWLYAIVLESFDALLTEDAAKGTKAAAAIATYSALLAPGLERMQSVPLADDSWRAKAPPSTPGTLDLGLRDGVGGQLLGYGYDFAYNFMTDAQRATVRGVIARATAGKLWMGARLPHHFRNWNWCAVGLQQPLLALAIEGEQGYDPRVYRLGVEIARDYLTYGISPSGVSTEAVGYTQFGLVWANPFIVAASRRGEPLLTHPHFRAMVDWYLHANEPARTLWTSHGDGGDGGPSLGSLSMWRHFFPADPKIASVWRSLALSMGDKLLTEKTHIIEALLWAEADPAFGKLKPADAATRDAPAALGLPVTLVDPVRGSLITRNDWSTDSAYFQFECRVDSVGASHEHADRGMFTFAALGRTWAKDNFRSVETRHHNNVLIDGLGQGYWPGPGRWLGVVETPDAVIAACDAKDAYAWFWPKQIVAENPDTFDRFNYARWESYRAEARKFQAEHAGLTGERDPRPSVVAHWQGFSEIAGGPRMWDEDGWPVRYPHNPVERAFRTVLFARGAQPYALIVDDIQKDTQERLYEWLMQTGPDTEIASIAGNELVLCDATVKRGPDGLPRPAKGDRQLLVRVLDQNDPALARAYTSRPSLRLDTFERKDTLAPESKTGTLSGSRSFGLDKRLVVPSRSVAPDFKILLYPHRAGEPAPETTWNEARTELTLKTPAGTDVIRFIPGPDGRTRVAFTRGTAAPLALD